MLRFYSHCNIVRNWTSMYGWLRRYLQFIKPMEQLNFQSKSISKYLLKKIEVSVLPALIYISVYQEFNDAKNKPKITNVVILYEIYI